MLLDYCFHIAHYVELNFLILIFNFYIDIDWLSFFQFGFRNLKKCLSPKSQFRRVQAFPGVI